MGQVFRNKIFNKELKDVGDAVVHWVSMRESHSLKSFLIVVFLFYFFFLETPKKIIFSVV